MRKIERLSLQLSLLEDKEFETDMQCPHCKSRKGYYKWYSTKDDRCRYRTLICKKCAQPTTSVESYPDGYSPRKKYKCIRTWASLHKRHRTYLINKRSKEVFHTQEVFEHAEPNYTTVTVKRS